MTPFADTEPARWPTKQRPIYKVNGKRVASVTTVIGAVKGNEHLVGWANRLGLEGTNSNEVRDESAAVGTLVHAIIEADITGEGDPKAIAAEYHPEIQARARVAWKRWVEFRDEHEIEPLELELEMTAALDVAQEMALPPGTEGVLPLGGTLDLLARVDGQLEVCDFKSGNRAYPEALVQMAGYHMLAEANDIVEGNMRPESRKRAKHRDYVTGYRVIHIPADPTRKSEHLHTATYAPSIRGGPQPLATYRAAFIAAYQLRGHWRRTGVI